MELFLSVIRARPVFAQMMLFQDVPGDGTQGGIQGGRAEGHVSAHFKGDAVLERVHGVFSEGERCVMDLQDGRHFEWAELQLAQALDNGDAGEMLIVLRDFSGCERAHQWDGAVKVVRVRGAEAGNLTTRLRKHGGMQAVRVRDAADLGEFTVKDEMRFRVGGGPEAALHHPAIQVEDDDVGGRELQIIHAAGFDGPEAGGTVHAADVAPSQAYEAAGLQGTIGFTDLFAEILEGH